MSLLTGHRTWWPRRSLAVIYPYNGIGMLFPLRSEHFMKSVFYNNLHIWQTVLLLNHLPLLHYPSKPPVYIQSIMSCTGHIKTGFTMQIMKILKKWVECIWNTRSNSEGSHVGWDQRLVLTIMKNWLIKALFNLYT